jgi:hypothetical protein
MKGKYTGPSVDASIESRIATMSPPMRRSPVRVMGLASRSVSLTGIRQCGSSSPLRAFDCSPRGPSTRPHAPIPGV